MKSFYRFLSYSSLLTLLTFAACARSEMAKQSKSDDADKSALQAPATPQPVTQQTPGEPAPMRDQVVIQDGNPRAVDPQAAMTPSNAPPPTMMAPTGVQQVGAPPSESPAGTPPGGMTGSTSGRPASEQPFGGQDGSGTDVRKRLVEAMLIGKEGFEQVSVIVGTDGCMILAGKVATAEKKEEAAALARGAMQGGCVMNRIEIGK